MPYSAAVCATCAKEVHVIVFVNLDITFSAHQIWTPTTNGDGSSSISTATVSAAPTSIGYTPAYATGPFGPVKTYSVTVSGLRYQPEAVAGRVGDVVEFVFGAGNHSVTQADFNSPCVPKAGGFGSGFRTDVVSAIIDPIFSSGGERGLTLLVGGCAGAGGCDVQD